MSGFVMVPAWLRRRKPSGNAVIAYITLASFGTFNQETGTYDECRPALATMSEECGLQERTLQRGITELIGYGAVERTVVVDPIRGRQPSIYRVIFGHLAGPEQTTAAEIVTADVGEASQVTDPLASETVTGVTREVSQVTPGRRQESHGGGVTGDVEPRTPTTDNPETKKNTTTRERVDAGDPLASPMFMVDTTSVDGVWSGQTATAGDTAKAHYAETKRVTDDIMINYSEWFERVTGGPLAPAEDRKIRSVVNGLVNDRRTGDDVTRLRNAIAAGLGNWTRSNSFSAKQIPDFVLLAKRESVPQAPARPQATKSDQRRQRLSEAVAAATGSDRDLLATLREQSAKAGFGSSAAFGAIEGHLA